MNILHMTVLYRRIDFFDMVVKYEVLARGLLSYMENDEKSILYMVS